MSVTLNARGTSIPFFMIGKKGVTIFQGSTDPQLTYTIKNGDIWVNDSTHTISSWYSSSSSWGPPAAGYLNFPLSDGSSGQVLATNALGQLSFVNRVSTLSVVSANGLAGSVANATTTPAITLTTTVTGVIKGNGTAFSAATSGTDYSAGTSSLATGILKSTTSTGALSIATLGTDYSAGTSSLATGILKSTTSTGALTIAVASDFPILNQNTTGTAANVTGTVAIANGGSGQTTANTALNAFLPSQTGNANKGLVTDGTNTSWQTEYPTGGSGDKVFFENQTNVTQNYTVTSGSNAMSAGPITVNTGVTVTV